MAVVDTLEIQVTGDGVKELSSALHELAAAMNKVTAPARRATKSITEAGQAAKEAGKQAETASSGIAKLASSFLRMAKTRILRMIIREIFQNITDGLKNVYEYSKQASGAAGEYAKNMDALKSSWQTLGNQIGAALAALLNALAPIITYIIDALTWIFEKITAIFAFFTGQSGYYKANKVVASLSEDTEAGAKAAKEWKNQLMGFDEINRLNDNSGSGSGSGNTSANDNYTWVPIDFNLNDIWQKIKDTIILIKDGFNGLSNTVAEACNSMASQFEAFAERVRTSVGNLGGVFDLYSQRAKSLGREIYDMFPAPDTSQFEVGCEEAGAIIGGFQKEVEDVCDAIESGFQAAMKGAANWVLISVNSIVTNFTMAGAAIRSSLSTTVESAKSWVRNATENIGKFFSNMGTTISTALQKVIDWVKRAIDWLDNLASVIGIVESTLGIAALGGGLGAAIAGGSVTGLLSSLGFASGGFVQGDVFVANEAGPELVGTIGGKTAVASNQEITGISSAVYSIGNAIVNAINSKDTSVSLDGKKMAEALYPYTLVTSARHGASMINA